MRAKLPQVSSRFFVKKLQANWLFLTYLFTTILYRIWNFQNSLYFIYDQGRDAWVFDKILHGHPVLVGPTSGLSGFFLGPLWCYLGLPGYILFNGNPYGICIWYIFISCLALPLFWWLAHKLFATKWQAVFAAFALALIPGSLTASLMIWNPLISVPLMAATVFCFFRARASSSTFWLSLGFFSLALTLQSEFAYAIFLIIPLFFLIPWIKKSSNFKDFIAVIISIGVTLVPQLLFEVRNHFLMTQTLLKNSLSSANSVSWATQLQQRPGQLLEATQHILIGNAEQAPFLFALLTLLFCIGVLTIVRAKVNQNLFLWRLLLVFALLPYPFYMIWRGNNGYFFWYYLTCHFLFLLPIILLGGFTATKLFSKKIALNLAVLSTLFFLFFTGVAVTFKNWNDTVFQPVNNAGLAKMISAVKTIYFWHAQDASEPFIVRTYTANVYTEQYDYLFYRFAKNQHLSPPSTVADPTAKTWFILIEESDRSAKVLFDKWYADATKGGKLIKQQQVGILKVEQWQK